MIAREVWHGYVRADWVDYNGHMNDAAYAKVFSTALDSLMDHIGLDETGRSEEDYTIFTLEAHLKYLEEAHEGQWLRVLVTLLDVDTKRMHLWFMMENDQGALLATSEQMAIGMDQNSGYTAPFPDKVDDAISKLPLLDQKRWPEAANQPMGLYRKKG